MDGTEGNIKSIQNTSMDESEYEEIDRKYAHTSDWTANHYDSSDYISRPILAKGGTVPSNILEFHHSFGYDCRKYYNLCVPDSNTLIFVSGNLIHFFDVTTGNIWFRRGSTGGGIGHICKNPTFDHIAVGENGINPPIIVYLWPTMDIITILLGGTTRCYSHLAYSPDGLLLISQGGGPDYLITLWDWRESKIVLRCKSHGQDVYNTIYSASVPGHLVTCGAGHIKTWKMVKTFTGLKLKGQLGRFGKTELSDILGIYLMPDEKVVSSCEWGNILIWDEGKIKVEVQVTGGKLCHIKPITQFEHTNGELISVGMDGWIRVWYYETMDLADPPDESRVLQISPIYEFEIGENIRNHTTHNAMIMCIRKREPNNPENTFWYAQDGNGGLWLIDLNVFGTPAPPKKILSCHAGPIVDMDIADWGPIVVTLGRDGRLHFYNYREKRLILVHHFHDIGSQVVWFPCKNAHPTEINFSVLVTGSLDSTIFAFSIHSSEPYLVVIPIGFVTVPSGVTCMAWKPQCESTLLVGCLHGDLAEIELPREPQPRTTTTYELTKCVSIQFKFHSVKSSIIREKVRLEYQKKKEARQAKIHDQLQQLRSNNPGMELDEETFSMDSEEVLPLPDIYIPEVPNKVLMTRYTEYDTIWLSTAGYDAGYIYEYPAPGSNKVIEREPTKSIIIQGADDTEIRTCLLWKNKYLFMGMEHGEIRVCKVKADYTDLSDYWILPLHDNYNGCIPTMLFSYDQKMLLTCGYDGNLFSFQVNDNEVYKSLEIPTAEDPKPLPDFNVEDVGDPEGYPTLEEVILKDEHNKLMAFVKRKKNEKLRILHKLSEEYGSIMERNRKLPLYQHIPHYEFELDSRITADLSAQLNTEIDRMHKKLAFQIDKSNLQLQKMKDHVTEPVTSLTFAICRILSPHTRVYSLREHKLVNYTSIAQLKHTRGTKTDSMIYQKMDEAMEEQDIRNLREQESFVTSCRTVNTSNRLRVQINYMLRKFIEKKMSFEERKKEWNIMYASKAASVTMHEDDTMTIDEAKRSVGDYKLKTESKYEMKQEQQITTLSKYKAIINCRKKLHHVRENFNENLKSVRMSKQSLRQETFRLIGVLKKIHTEIPRQNMRNLPIIFTIDTSIEVPGKSIEVGKFTSITEQAMDAKRKRQSILAEEIRDTPDPEYEVLLLKDGNLYRNHSDILLAISSITKIQPGSKPDAYRAFISTEQGQSVWEQEMKSKRMKRKIYEQDCLLRRIQTNYENFDEKLNELEKERLEIIVTSLYLEIYLLTLRREQEILNDFQKIENILRERVVDKTREHSITKQKMNMLSSKIEHKNKEIAKIQEKIKNLSVEYVSMINENKFYNFLFKIYKKKYKPVKDKAENVLESMSASSATSELTSEDDHGGDDTISTRSKSLSMPLLDENICPPGCDKRLYGMAFSMRKKRYQYEFHIKDEQRGIETLSHQLDNEKRKSRVIDHDLKHSKEELENFMLEKQRKLNEIDMTLVFKFHQLQHFTTMDTLTKIRSCIVFDRKVLSKLNYRIEKLNQETADQRAKQKKNEMHLHRMEVDCKYMDTEITLMQNLIKEETARKFGQELSTMSLFENILRWMLRNIKADVANKTTLLNKQCQSICNKYEEESSVLVNLISENTKKLSFLTILEGKQFESKEIGKKNVMSKEYVQLKSWYEVNLRKLKNILKNQVQQNQQLQNDIRNLSEKSKFLSPVFPTRKLPLSSKSRNNGTSCVHKEDKHEETIHEENFFPGSPKFSR